MLAALCVFGGAAVAVGQLNAGFDAASASSTAIGDYGASNALASGSSYWCRRVARPGGGFVGSDTFFVVAVRAGTAKARVFVGPGLSTRLAQLQVFASIGTGICCCVCVCGQLSLCLRRAYAPGEFKVLTSEDGANFEEAACARAPSQGQPSFVETVMLEAPKRAAAVAVVMQSPKPWHYFGINEVSLLVDPYAFMLVSGATASSGESCLVAQGAVPSTASCLSSIAVGDGREIFRLDGEGLLEHLPSKQCLSAAGGTVALQSCVTASRAIDGRSLWSMSAAGEVQLSQTPDMCLVTTPGGPGVAACSGAGDAGKWSMVAVPEYDPAAVAAMGPGASALAASVARQQGLISELRSLLPKLASCKLASSLLSNGTSVALVAGAAATQTLSDSVATGQDATSAIYAAFGVDMGEVGRVISEAAGVLETAQGKLAHAS